MNWEDIPAWPPLGETDVPVSKWSEARPGVLLRTFQNARGLTFYQHKYRCQDCKVSWEHEREFHVTDSLWDVTMGNKPVYVGSFSGEPFEVLPRGGGWICKGCFERKLGRTLTKEDMKW